MNKQYNISEFARRIGRSASSVRRWEREGLIRSKRLPSGHRYFDEDDVRGILGKSDEKRLTIVYCRVSSHGQKDDLQSQVSAMEHYCLGAGIAVDEWIQEIGGGMNFKRKKFLSRLIVAHKDRLVRFGFDLLDHIAKCNSCIIEVVNQESLSPQEEMTEDLLSIVHTFSCRLYGMRKYKRKND